MAAALAVAGAGAAGGEPDIPEFALPVYFLAPDSPGAIAATPIGFDLVGAAGSGTPNQPDGFTEIAVAGNEGEDAGWVWFYRNNATPANPDIALVPFLTVNVFSEIGVNLSHNAFITDIALANLTDDDDDPDLIVAVSHWDPQSTQIDRGKVATFKATRDQLTHELIYTFIYVENIDYPVTGLTVGEYGADGRQHVLAACDSSGEVGSAPSRVFVLQNSFDALVAPNYGKLVHVGDLATSPIGNNPTRSIVAGQFSLITGGGMGGGGGGGGNTLDFAAFGAGTSGVTLGIGNGNGAFTFSVTPVLGAACNGSPIIGFGTGLSGVGGSPQVTPIVDFDPFASSKRSLATTDGPGVSLIHYVPRSGSFSHLCDGEVSLDYYFMEPIDCGGPEPLLNSGVAHVARGRFNDDTYDDLVYVNPTKLNPMEAAYAAFLLGRGAPGIDGRIMLYNNCHESGHHVPYESTMNGGEDRVLCVNLNNEGFDEVLITRGRTAELIVLKNITGSN